MICGTDYGEVTDDQDVTENNYMVNHLTHEVAHGSVFSIPVTYCTIWRL